jgi:alkylation response protein AidB-like acyl-CoA dehydrogenase
MQEEQRAWLAAWQKRCHEAGLVGADFPREYGGHGHKGFQAIANQEMTRAGTPYMLNVIGLSMAAPTILVHGTEEQKRRFLPPLLAADEIWCQGFSSRARGATSRGRSRRPSGRATTGSSTATRCGRASRTSRAG